MKNLLYIFLTIIFTGCSKSSENEVDSISIVDKWYVIKTEYYEKIRK